VLVGLAGAASSIAVGCPAWYAWLEDATTFAFRSAEGGFTARKERRGQTGWYWKAYRKRDGTLHRAYLGKSADLTLDRLSAIASELAQRASAPPALESSSVLDVAMTATDDDPQLLPAAQLPTGTLTFLFTDIEGSTQLWEQHPGTMPAALARHDTILRQAVAGHGGVVFKTVGDGVHAVFARASDALEAAQAAQQALHIEGWGETSPLRVRMALHSGVAELRDGDYFGAALNRVARILALGHGGQTLLSHATHDLVADDLPAQITLRELGEYPLKDLSRPENVFQVVTPDVPADFPPLRTLEAQPARSPPAAAPLLATKLFIPALRSQLVPRPRLLERVQAGLNRKLTLVAAPAGFGKTTLVSAWRATPTGSAMPLAWVSLDADDNDPMRFWTYVIAALETVYPSMDTTAGALLRSPQPPPMDVIVSSLINAITPLATDAALILDDYHLISTPAIHTSVTFLLDHLPVQLHLIMLTRADPPLPLTRLRARGELTELRAADLRFTADEAVAFLIDVMALPLSSAEVAALSARTEGWIAGLQLAALAMQNRSDHAGFVAAFSGNNRFVVDYLVEEVLARLPAHLQTFLLQTSILDRLCGGLCDALLLGDERGANPGAQAYSQLVLHELERANLFLIPLDDERHWYRYHHLFAEVLHARLHSGATASEVTTLYSRASAWHAQAGLIDEAVRYAFLAHDVQQAAALIAQHGMAIILSSSDVSVVRAWVEQLPRALISTRPRLVVITGIILGVLRQFDAVERLLADAAPALSADDLSLNTLGELTTLRSLIARFQSDSAGTLNLAQQALDQLDHDNHGFRAIAAINIGIAFLERGEHIAAKVALAEAIALGELGGLWIALAALEELMSLQLRQGLLREMRRTSEQAIELSARLGGRRIPATGMGYVGIAEVYYQRNDLAGATHAATQGVDLLRGTTERLLLVRGYIVRAQISQAHGDRVGALESIDRGEAWLAQTRITVPKYLCLLAAYRTRLWLQQGNLAAAARWAQECVLVGDHEVGYVQQLTLVRLCLAQREHDHGGPFLGDAHTILTQVLPAVEAHGWMRYLIEGLMLQALVCQAQADRIGALSVLQRALTLAEPEGYVRVFVDEGTPMAALLRAAHQHGIALAYVARLLDAFPERREAGDLRLADTLPATNLKPQASTLVEPLSDRELDVLRLIAEGHSNQAIADQLIVAVSTVKKHVNNIYGKLDVQSRTQALLRARELHLL
jgi:LuxR family transcriptional regulator, maltose regulon positive regulatory protein